jgi:superfamily II DNA/RNA helicase
MYKKPYRSKFRSFNQKRFNRFPRKRRGAGFNGGSKVNISQYIKKPSPSPVVAVEVSTTAFSDFLISDKLKANIAGHGFVKTTPIQEKAIPTILDGRDVVGVANTGTGKTGAFLIPLIEKILKNPAERVLILVPTRELGQQIKEELRQLTYNLPIYSCLCIGGSFIRNQIFQLKRDPHFVIGTPGRIKDLIRRKALNISGFQNVVLDEVDRMVDMGFIQDIKLLLSHLPIKRQSMFFSATIPTSVNAIVQSFLINPITIFVRSQDTPDNVEQDIVRVEPGKTKVEILEALLGKEEFKKVLIFGRTKIGVEKLSVHLNKHGFKAVSIHGDKPQFKRTQAIHYFKDRVVNILVATDVAARGLDIADITHVINYDEPATYEDYIHRIGRTGRGSKKGQALTFIQS